MAVEKLIVDHIDTWTTAQQTRSTAGAAARVRLTCTALRSCAS